MALLKDGSKLVENCIKMLSKSQTKNKNQVPLLICILDEIVSLPVAEGYHG